MRRYQNGTLELTKTAEGPCWYLRFTEADGKRPRYRLGLKTELPSKTKALQAAQPYREKFNRGELAAVPIYTVGMLIDRYETEEMPERYSTSRGYRKIHKNYIRPRWEAQPLAQIAPLEVRAWLRDLKLKSGAPASSKSKGHVHTQFKNLLKHAMLWQWMPLTTNPLSLFSLEGSTKRTRIPRVVPPADFQLILEYFAADPLMKTLCICTYLLGLRISETIGLRWSDIDHLHRTVGISRAVVRGREDRVKTERSESPLPLAPQVAEALLRWREVTNFKAETDWVFASPLRLGRVPVDANKLQSKRLRAAGKSIGLEFSLGWHTFRHSYKSLLDRVSSDSTLKRDLMRHSDVHTTMQVYGEVEMDRLREANAAAVDLALGKKPN